MRPADRRQARLMSLAPVGEVERAGWVRGTACPRRLCSRKSLSFDRCRGRTVEARRHRPCVTRVDLKLSRLLLPRISLRTRKPLVSRFHVDCLKRRRRLFTRSCRPLAAR